ncbi:MAG TPA: 30S ribosomal protein S7 [Candidatus Paceibacterota bacterium]
MRRRLRESEKRKVAADLQYGSPKVFKFTNYLMYSGKKNTARKVLYDAMKIIKESGADPLETLETAVRNAGPTVEVRSRRVGGANYQVPREVRPERRQALGMKWVIEAARGKKGKPMAAKLADEIILAAKNEGEAIKKRENVHRMAEANKAFAHFTW